MILFGTLQSYSELTCNLAGHLLKMPSWRVVQLFILFFSQTLHTFNECESSRKFSWDGESFDRLASDWSREMNWKFLKNFSPLYKNFRSADHFKFKCLCQQYVRGYFHEQSLHHRHHRDCLFYPIPLFAQNANFFHQDLNSMG